MNDRPPDWIPQDLRALWAHDRLVLVHPRPVHFGDLPDGTTVRLDAGAHSVTVGADSVGTGVVLEVQAGAGTPTVTLGPEFHRVDVRRVSGEGQVNLVLHRSMSLQLHGSVKVMLRTGEEKHPVKVQLRLHGEDEDVQVSGEDHIQLTHLEGDGNLTLAGLGLASDVEVALGGDLTMRRAGQLAPFQAASLTIGGAFRAGHVLQSGATITAASIHLENAQDIVPCVPDGAELTATKGPVYVRGDVGGEADPTSVTAADGQDVTVTGTVANTEVHPLTGQLGMVDLDGATEVTVGAAEELRVGQGDHSGLTVSDVMHFTTSGTLSKFDVTATEVDIAALSGPGSLKMARGCIRSAVTDASRATVTVADWLRLGVNAQLRVTAADELAEGAANVALGTARELNSQQAPNAVPENYLAPTNDNMSVTNPSVGTVELQLSGRLRVRVPVDEAVIDLEDGVEALMLDRTAVVRTHAPHPVRVGGVRALGELTLEGHLSVATYLRAASLVGRTGNASVGAQTVIADAVHGCSVTCAGLTVHGDVTKSTLVVHRKTIVTGTIKVSEAPPPELCGDVQVFSSQVDLHLTDAHGRLGPESMADDESTMFADIAFAGERRGELEVNASMGELRASGRGATAVVRLDGRSVVSRLVLGGSLDLQGGKVEGRDARFSVVHAIELMAGAALKVAGLPKVLVTALPSSIDATVTLESADSEVVLGTDAGSMTVEAHGNYDLYSQADMEDEYEPTAAQLTLVGGQPTMRGAFQHVTFERGVGAPSLSLPRSSRVVAAAGRVRLALLQGELSGGSPAWHVTARFRRTGSRLERVKQGKGLWATVRNATVRRLFGPGGGERLVIDGIDYDGSQADKAFSGALLNTDVTELGRSAISCFAHLDEFAPEPASLERCARARRGSVAERVRRANKLNDIANITRAHASDGSTRTRARWSALHAHASTSGRLVGFLHGLSRRLGYRQRPGPPLAMFVLLASAWLAMSYPGPVSLGGISLPKPHDIEAWMCETHLDGVVSNASASPTQAEEIASYGLYQRFQRTLLAPTSTLKSITGVSANGLEPIGCGSLPGLLVTILLSITLVYGGIGLAKLVGPPANTSVRKR